jgi:hypothetical protein
MIEAQCASILVPHDHLHINQKRTSAASNHVDGSTQITRSGVIRDRHRGNQAADHIDGSRVRLSRYRSRGANMRADLLRWPESATGSLRSR